MCVLECWGCELKHSGLPRWQIHAEALLLLPMEFARPVFGPLRLLPTSERLSNVNLRHIHSPKKHCGTNYTREWNADHFNYSRFAHFFPLLLFPYSPGVPRVVYDFAFLFNFCSFAFCFRCSIHFIDIITAFKMICIQRAYEIRAIMLPLPNRNQQPTICPRSFQPNYVSARTYEMHHTNNNNIIRATALL